MIFYKAVISEHVFCDFESGSQVLGSEMLCGRSESALVRIRAQGPFVL